MSVPDITPDEPPAAGQQAPPIGDVGEPTPAPVEDTDPTGEPTPPPVEDTLGEPDDTDYDDVSSEVPCVDVPAHDGDRWCTPPPSGDTIQLFSDWGTFADRGVRRCGHDGYDPGRYVDPGRTHVDNSRVCRTLPLTLQIGTVIEDYDINGNQYQVHRVLGIGDEPWPRNAVWTDVVYPICLCSQYWSIFPGYEDLGFLPAPTTGETMHIAWRDSDGRWRIRLSPGMIAVGEGC